LKQVLAENAEELIRYATVYCDYAKRTTITAEDIAYACKRQGISLYY